MALGVLLLSLFLGQAATGEGSSHIDFSFEGRGSPDAVYGILSRVLGLNSSDIFDLSLADTCASPKPEVSRSSLCFDILQGFTPDKKVAIRATSGPELAYGAAHYLRTQCAMSFSWNRTGGHRVQIPDVWPTPEKVTRYRMADVSYFMNVVTFSYTFAFYTFSEWEYLLDWAALGGVNVALAYTGQEEVFRKVLNQFNVSDEVFASWSNGPAYLAWSRGQEMHGIAAPVPLSFFKAQWSLQKQILSRMRSIGMVGVLPTFQGNVPPELRAMYPNANMTRDPSKNFSWIDACDPLFGKIADVYMRQLIEDFGTDHWYEADGYFNMKSGPWYTPRRKSQIPYPQTPYPSEGADWTHPSDVPVDAEALAHATAAYTSMNRTDPKAIWLYQGWIWRGWGDDMLPYMKGFTSGAPKGKFVMLDMYDEEQPEWNKFGYFSYFDTPYIWSVLHNFGGNTGMWGSLPLLNSAPFDALQNSSSLLGTGFAPEGFDQNPVYYQLCLDLNFETEPIELSEFLKSYAAQRYGSPPPPSAIKAWSVLSEAVYGDVQPSFAKQDFMCEKTRDALSALPLGPAEDHVQPDWYNVSEVVKAWGLFVDAAGEIELYSKLPCYAESACLRTLRYDLVNTGREAMAKLSNRIFFELMNATTAPGVEAAGSRLLDIMADADRLLCSDDGFTASGWIHQAQRLGDVLGMRDYMELNARSQTTVWTPQEKGSTTLTLVVDYANKHWGGQVGGFYRNRTRLYVQQASEDFSRGKPVNVTAYFAKVAQWSYEWTNDLGGSKYPICQEVTGDAVEISKELLKKYGRMQ